MRAKENYLQAIEEWANIYIGRSLSDYFIFLKRAGISMQQAYVLTYIHYNSSCKISEICDHMLVSPAAASQMVDRLESQNLAARIADPEDRRVRSVLLTEQGKTFVYQSIEARSKWARVVPAELNDKELNQISNALQLLVSAYRQE